MYLFILLLGMDCIVLGVNLGRLGKNGWANTHSLKKSWELNQ